MTNNELRAFREALALSARQFALLVGASDGRAVRRWESGERPVPQHLALLAMLSRDIPSVADWLANRGAMQ